MDITLNVWLAFGTGLVLGAFCIFLLQRRSAAAERERAEQLTSELNEAREELDAHRDEVAKHFQQTSQIFRSLTEEYSRLYAHLAEGAREFCTDDMPALARGFDGPLLGRNGDDAGTPDAADPQVTQAEPRVEQGNGADAPGP